MSHPTAMAPAATPAARLKSFGLRLAVFIVFGLLFAACSEYMPVGETVKRALTRIWGPLLTQDYPAGGREQISVLLLDDDDLGQYGETWPVSLGFHARRISELATYQPKAIFIDLVFLDNRRDPELDGFIAAACQARQAGIPVLIGSFRHAGKSSATQQQMLARTVASGGQAVPCIEEAYLNLKIDGVDQSVWEYELGLEGKGGHGEGAQHAAPAYLSPAAKLFSVGHALPEQAFAQPMAVIWGTSSHPTNADWMATAGAHAGQDGGAGEGPAACSRAWSWQWLIPFTEKQAPLCPYNRALPFRTLKKSAGFSQAQLSEAITGKYIIYGTDLQSTGDTIVSPYHGRLPGSYLHAMALDNLLSFKGAPKAAGEFDLHHPLHGKATIFIVLAIALISAIIAYQSVYFDMVCAAIAQRLRRWRPQRPAVSSAPARALRGWPLRLRALLGLIGNSGRDALSFLSKKLLVGAVYVLAILFLLHLSYETFGLGPLVWIEYVLFPLGLEFLEWSEKIEHFARHLRQSYLGIAGKLAALEEAA